MVSSQNSELYENQHTKVASMKEPFFSDSDSSTGVFPEQREKNAAIHLRNLDEGSEVDLV